MKLLIKIAAPLAAAVALSACGTYEVDDVRGMNVQGNAFNDQLARNYRDLALYEADRMYDWTSAPWYARKAQLAANGQLVAAANLDGKGASFDVPRERRAELTQGYQRLDAAMREGARTRYPALAATAQAKYDCWVEQSAENWQYDHIASCRDDFNLAMERMETPIDAGPPVLIFFDWDQAVLEREAVPIVNQLADSLRNRQGEIRVTGHADTSGPRDYNYDLGMRRAQTVAAALADRGVDRQRMTLVSEGETDLRVPTADGVREPQNRRVNVQAETQRPAMASR